jgi:hypothetical protein
MVCISVLHSKAQNWQTVPVNDTNWFVINNTPNIQSGRLRVAWLDSSQTDGSISTNYFYPALRMDSTGCLDTAGASWLGKKYTRNQITGEEYYFNFIGDTLTIKTWSQLGETWLMTTDTNSVAFQAQVISVNSLNIDGGIDSIKTIGVQAYQNGLPISHIYNNTVVLSKNHGFLRTLEWYAFPYTLNLNYQFVESFTEGHNRLDQSKTSISFNETKSKYTPGNEWITDYSVRKQQGPIYSFRQTLVNDRIIDVIDTTNGYKVIFQSKKRVNDFDSNTFITSDSVYTKFVDTTTFSSNRIVDILPEYIDFEFGYHPTFISNLNGISIYHYEISYGCNQQIRLQKTFSGSGTVNDMGNGCIIYQTLMVDPYYLPHLNTLQEEEIGLFNSFEMDTNMVTTDFSHIWYASNSTNCSYGMWYDIIVAADAFDLKATLHNQNQVHVNWQTTNEHHVARFDIDSKASNSDFKTIASVPTNGDNPLQNDYFYLDQLTSDLVGENIQYRIKMIDLDGKVQYSNTVGLNTKSVTEVRVFPNPFQHNITISGLVPTEEYVIELTNLVGLPLIPSSYSSDLKGNINLGQFNELPNGIYFIRISNAEGLAYSSKLVKLK